ncbi:MAG: GntR family transcriptional regulator [Actinobacteria bacterium]|nr:GntR family transcriptional regulator [Actinomycetota bacterium]
MEGLQRQVLSEAAYAALKARIINLVLPPGARLPLDQLAEQLRISPTPLREALTRLAAEKLVRFEPFKGFTVQPLLTFQELRHLHEVRLLLECHALENSAGRVSRRDLASLGEDVDAMDEVLNVSPLDVERFNSADARFHDRLISLAGNPMLTETYRSLNIHVQIARLFHRRGAEQSTAANSEHRRIVEALRRGDGQAAAEHVASHVRAVVRRLQAVGTEAYPPDVSGTGRVGQSRGKR